MDQLVVTFEDRISSAIMEPKQKIRRGKRGGAHHNKSKKADLVSVVVSSDNENMAVDSDPNGD
jgi:hypothetical protein